MASKENPMRRLVCTMSVVAVFAAANVMASGGVLAVDAPQVNLTEWTPPDISTVGNDAFGKLVKYGYALMTDTANQIGPMVADPAKRYSGNNLTCQNCHLKAGTQPYAMPVTGVWGQFPQYRGREGEVGTLEDRINGCMERSMNGRALPLSGTEMKAFLAYTKWVSTGIPDGAKLVGSGAMSVKEPGRAADLGHGQQVYVQVCAACHGKDGLGQRAASGNGYQFPPLWGPDSYNNGAGMARLLGAAAFVERNMPFGTTYAAPVLSDQDAYDVAGFINSAERPQRANLDKDFPNRLQKPVDTAYGPYADDFSPEQHKLGPFDPIRAKLKELAAQAAAKR
jgi:thiosulfate dehydrogenase